MAESGSLEKPILEALSNYLDPETGRSIVDLDQVQSIRAEGDGLQVSLGLSSWSAPLWPEIKQEIEALVSSTTGRAAQVDIAEIARPPEKIGQIGLAVKSVIAVGSGKGGVGKSTISATLALGLQNAGSKVGLLDADVYGPSIPHLLGVDQRPEAVERKLQPVMAAGLKVMSMGFLVPPGEAVVWRGPMLHGAITQFLRDTDWGKLDYLIIDMPPGTGDIALTLSQLLPLTGSVVVCTPQDVALLDAVKAIAMFRKVSIDVLGVVENMSFFECPGCHSRHEIFGNGGAQRKASELNVPFLGEVPIQMEIRSRGDSGQTAEIFQDEKTLTHFVPICERLVRNISAQNRAAPPMPSLNVI